MATRIDGHALDGGATHHDPQRSPALLDGDLRTNRELLLGCHHRQRTRRADLEVKPSFVVALSRRTIFARVEPELRTGNRDALIVDDNPGEDLLRRSPADHQLDPGEWMDAVRLDHVWNPFVAVETLELMSPGCDRLESPAPALVRVRPRLHAAALDADLPMRDRMAIFVYNDAADRRAAMQLDLERVVRRRIGCEPHDLRTPLVTGALGPDVDGPADADATCHRASVAVCGHGGRPALSIAGARAEAQLHAGDRRVRVSISHVQRRRHAGCEDEQDRFARRGNLRSQRWCEVIAFDPRDDIPTRDQTFEHEATVGAALRLLAVFAQPHDHGCARNRLTIIVDHLALEPQCSAHSRFAPCVTQLCANARRRARCARLRRSRFWLAAPADDDEQRDQRHHRHRPEQPAHRPDGTLSSAAMGANFGFIAMATDLSSELLLEEARTAARDEDCAELHVFLRRGDVGRLFENAGAIDLTIIAVAAREDHPGIDTVAERLARRTGSSAVAIFIADRYLSAGYQHYFRGPVPTHDGQPVIDTPDEMIDSYAGLLVDTALDLPGRHYSYLDVTALAIGALLGREVIATEKARLSLAELIYDGATDLGSWAITGDDTRELGPGSTGSWSTMAMTWPGAVRAARNYLQPRTN